MQRYLVLKELPKGQQPGTIVELDDQHAGIFLSVGAIAPAPADAPPPPAAAPPPAQEPKERTPRSPRYDRRDLKATDE